MVVTWQFFAILIESVLAILGSLLKNKSMSRNNPTMPPQKEAIESLVITPVDLQRIGLALTATLDRQQIFNTAAQEIAQLGGAGSSCTIFAWDQADDSLHQLARHTVEPSPADPAERSHLSLSHYPFFSPVLNQGLPQQLVMSQLGPDTAEFAYLAANHLKFLLLLPLARHDQPLGLIELASPAELKLAEDTLSLLHGLAGQVANAGHNAERYEQTQRQILALRAAPRTAKKPPQASEEKFKTIFQESLDAILLIHGTNGQILELNRAAERILGYENGSLLGQHFSVLLPPAPKENLLERMRLHDAVFAGQEFIRADGSVCPVDLTATVIVLGQEKSVLTTLREVSERRQVEQALMQLDRELFSLQYTGAVLASSLDLHYLLDTIIQELVQLLEVQACLIFEWDRTNKVAVPLAFQGPAAWQTRRKPAVAVTLADDPTLVRLLENRTVQISKISQPDLDPAEAAYMNRYGIKTLLRLPMEYQNRVVGLVEIIESDTEREITVQELRLAQLLANQAATAIQTTRLYQQAQQEIAERKRIEADLWEEKNFASAIFNAPNALVTVLDLDGRIERFNQACEQTLGYSAAEVKDKVFWDILVAPEDARSFRGAIRQVSRNRLSKSEDSWVTKSGRRRLIAWSCSLLSGQDNSAGQVICIGIDITERKQIEERLRSSEELFRQVVLSISDHIYVTEVTASGEVINKYISPNVEDLTGYPFKTFMDAWNFWPNVAIHPEDREIAAAQAQRLMTSGQPSEVEYRLIRADHRVIWVRDSGRVEIEGSSKVIYGVVSDITERKQRELEVEAIAVIATALRAALTFDEMLVLILDPILDLLQVEGTALEIYDPLSGETEVKLARGKWENVIGTRTEAGHGASNQVISSGEIYISNNVKNDQKLVWPRKIGGLTAVACVPLVAQAQTIGILWVGRQNQSITVDTVRLLRAISDIAANALYRATLFEQLQNSNAELVRFTADLEHLVKARTVDLERAVAEASESRDKIDAILYSVADGLIVTDIENKVVLMNPAAEHILGFKLEEMLGQEIGVGIKDDRLRQIVRGTLNQYISGYETDIEFEYPRDQQVKIMRAHTSLVDDRQGHRLGTVTILQDVTAIREVDRMKTEFITTAAHEFRTPLTSIQGFSEILLVRDLQKSRQKRYLTMIHQQATHLAEIVEDLLDVARLEARKGMAVQLKTVNLDEVIQEVLLPFIETEPERKIVVQGVKPLSNIKGDPFRLAQVSKNLISNAIKYSPAGSPVTITGRETANFVEITIRDEGIGMTRDQQKHLFEKFYRADASNTSIGGTGLGLNICKLIVELHDGKIWLESEYGRGSTVYVRLPKG
jgi:PAS domain S-box-containing protein